MTTNFLIRLSEESGLRRLKFLSPTDSRWLSRCQ